MAQMNSFDGDPKDLAECEKFFWQFIEMENVIERLKAWLYKLEFEEIYLDNKRRCDLVFNSPKLIRDSKAFKLTLACILGLGNYINGRSKKGCQHGFMAQTMAQLGDYKTTDNRMSILGYLYVFLRQWYPDSLKWIDEFERLSEAVRIESDMLDQEITAMDKDLDKVADLIDNFNARKDSYDIEVNSVASNRDENKETLNDDDPFVEVMTTFYKNAKKQVEELQKIFEDSIYGMQELAYVLYFFCKL